MLERAHRYKHSRLRLVLLPSLLFVVALAGVAWAYEEQSPPAAPSAKAIHLAAKKQPPAEQGPAHKARTEAAAETKHDVWHEPTTGMEFVWVEPGCYDMGCGPWSYNCGRDESPFHEVCVSGYWISRFPVTQAQWMKVMADNPSKHKDPANPVENVSWNDVHDFLDRLATQDQFKFRFRLPSEAQWEYACRSGGKPENFSGGNDVGQVAWFKGNSAGMSHPVGEKAANGLGLHDMSGNVWEWTEDNYDRNAYSRHEHQDPVYYEGSAVRKTTRGGSFNSDANDVRCSTRDGVQARRSNEELGFRLVRLP